MTSEPQLDTSATEDRGNLGAPQAARFLGAPPERIMRVLTPVKDVWDHCSNGRHLAQRALRVELVPLRGHRSASPTEQPELLA